MCEYSRFSCRLCLLAVWVYSCAKISQFAGLDSTRVGMAPGKCAGEATGGASCPTRGCQVFAVLLSGWRMLGVWCMSLQGLAPTWETCRGTWNYCCDDRWLVVPWKWFGSRASGFAICSLHWLGLMDFSVLLSWVGCLLFCWFMLYLRWQWVLCDLLWIPPREMGCCCCGLCCWSYSPCRFQRPSPSSSFSLWPPVRRISCRITRSLALLLTLCAAICIAFGCSPVFLDVDCRCVRRPGATMAPIEVPESGNIVVGNRLGNGKEKGAAREKSQSMKGKGWHAPEWVE